MRQDSWTYLSVPLHLQISCSRGSFFTNGIGASCFSSFEMPELLASKDLARELLLRVRFSSEGDLFNKFWWSSPAKQILQTRCAWSELCSELLTTSLGCWREMLGFWVTEMAFWQRMFLKSEPDLLERVKSSCKSLRILCCPQGWQTFHPEDCSKCVIDEPVDSPEFLWTWSFWM